jgi:hypothetical protein
MTKFKVTVSRLDRGAAGERQAGTPCQLDGAGALTPCQTDTVEALTPCQIDNNPVMTPCQTDGTNYASEATESARAALSPLTDR